MRNQPYCLPNFSGGLLREDTSAPWQNLSKLAGDATSRTKQMTQSASVWITSVAQGSWPHVETTSLSQESSSCEVKERRVRQPLPVS